MSGVRRFLCWSGFRGGIPRTPTDLSTENVNFLLHLMKQILHNHSINFLPSSSLVAISTMQRSACLDRSAALSLRAGVGASIIGGGVVVRAVVSVVVGHVRAAGVDEIR